MHSGDSSIKVPVEIGIEAGGSATRDGVASPRQQFIPVERRNLKPGSMLLNAGTLALHIVLAVNDEGVTIKTDDGPHTFCWEDVQSAAWQLVES